MNEFRKKVKEKIALYSNKEYLDGYIRNEFLTDDEDADICLKFTQKDELFDSKTVGRQLDLVSDVYDYIEEKSSMLDSDVLIDLHIIGLSLNSHEQELVRHILKEHYAIELYKVQKEYVKVKNKILVMLGIGILSFFIYTLFFFYIDFDFGLEVLGFLFSFSLWEGFDLLIFTLSEIKKEREDITQNLLMTVVFDENEG